MAHALAGKHILMVIAQNDFRDEELLTPKALFEDAGAQVTVAANAPGTCTGMLGATVQASLAVRDAQAANYHALVIPGGGGSPKYLWHNKDLHDLIHAFRNSGKQTHAICLSPAVLAIAGVLKGKRATVYATPESKAAFEQAGATYIDEPVVTDGDLVTGRDPDAAQAFGERVVQMLANAG